jgi:hypothetical protein
MIQSRYRKTKSKKQQAKEKKEKEEQLKRVMEFEEKRSAILIQRKYKHKKTLN